MKIFYVNGVAESGKDTFIKMAKETFPEGGMLIKSISTADRSKEIAMESFGWDGVKDEKGRELLSGIKMISSKYNNGPIKLVEREIALAKSLGYDAILIQAREFPEIMEMVDLFGGKTVVVSNPRTYPGRTEQKFLDMVPADYCYDIEIRNDGSLVELEEAAEEFVRKEIPWTW